MMGSYAGIAQGVQSDANLSANTIGGLGNLYYSTRNILNPGGTQFGELQTPGGGYFGTTIPQSTLHTAAMPGILEGMHLRGSDSFFATPLGFLIILSVAIFIIWLIIDRRKK